MAWDTALLKRSYDLANPRLMSDVIGPEFARAARPAFAAAEKAEEAIRAVYQKLTSVVPEELATVGKTVAIVADVILAAKGILEQATARWTEESTQRELAARDLLFAQRKDNEWRSRFAIVGPAAKDLDLKDSPGGWRAKDFLAQYKPPGVIFLRRAGIRDFVVASYPTWAMESQAGYISDGGEQPALVAQGAPERPGLLDRIAAIPPMPEKYGWNYLCDKPGANNDSAIERAISNMKCAPVPGSELAFSWGTFPYIGTNGEPWPLGPQGIATCLAMQGLTPVWAALSEDDVIRAYRHWLKWSRLRELPRNVKQQVDAYEMILDDDLLPYSPGDFAVPEFLHTLPVVTVWPERWRAIELSFRRFFALREMVLRQPQLLPKSLIQPIAANPDFSRKPRSNYTWADPLGDGWADPERTGRTPEQEAHAREQAAAKRSGRTPEQTEAAIAASKRRRNWIIGGGLAGVAATGAALLWRGRR